MNNEIIHLQGVDLQHNNHQVFTNANLKIKKGEFLYLIGDTGSGKSSLLKSLYGELQVNTGNISIANINIKNITHKEIPILRRKLGIVFQDFQLLSDRTVAANLEFVLKATGWKEKPKISKRISEVLESVHLKDIKEKMPHQLSGGEHGLVVGIIAFIAYNFLVSKVDKVVFMLEARTTDFLDLIHHNE